VAPSAKADSACCTSAFPALPSLVKTFFRPAGAMNLLHFVPRTNVRGYILVPLRGSRMMVLFHRGLDFCVLTQTLPFWAFLFRRYAADGGWLRLCWMSESFLTVSCAVGTFHASSRLEICWSHSTFANLASCAPPHSYGTRSWAIQQNRQLPGHVAFTNQGKKKQEHCSCAHKRIRGASRLAVAAFF